MRVLLRVDWQRVWGMVTHGGAVDGPLTRRALLQGGGSRHSFVKRFSAWLNSTFPHPGHRVVNLGIPAITSALYAACYDNVPEVRACVLHSRCSAAGVLALVLLRRQAAGACRHVLTRPRRAPPACSVLGQDSDLVILEFAINEGIVAKRWRDQQGYSFSTGSRRSFEQLVRGCVCPSGSPSSPAATASRRCQPLLAACCCQQAAADLIRVSGRRAGPQVAEAPRRAGSGAAQLLFLEHDARQGKGAWVGNAPGVLTERVARCCGHSCAHAWSAPACLAEVR